MLASLSLHGSAYRPRIIAQSLTVDPLLVDRSVHINDLHGEQVENWTTFEEL